MQQVVLEITPVVNGYRCGTRTFEMPQGQFDEWLNVWELNHRLVKARLENDLEEARHTIDQLRRKVELSWWGRRSLRAAEKRSKR